jgi:adenosine deaminase
MNTLGEFPARGRRDLRTLPKSHLHIHLEGAMRRSTLVEFAERYGMDVPEDTRGQRFDNFGGFHDTYVAACHSVRSTDDLTRLILEVAEDSADDGAWWIEPAFDAARFSTDREGSPNQIFKTQEEAWLFALSAAEEAERTTGVGIAFMSAADRTEPVQNALERAAMTAELVGKGQHMIHSGMPCFEGLHAGIGAFGLHANEEGNPPGPFAEAFRLACAHTDLLSTPHAGEIAPFPGGGPASVLSALDDLGADRILHGVLAIQDPQLVERLAQERICLDVCPSSNLLLKVFPSLEEHSLPALLEAGVPCSIGSDDPLLFGPSLFDEYELCREEMGLSDQQLAAVAKTSFEFSAAPQQAKDAGVAAVAQWLA